MNFENLRTVSREAGRIEDVFRREGLTSRQYRALIELYDKDTPRKDLKKEIGIENNGQLSRDVICSLREKGYIAPRRSGKPLSITPEGRNLIKKIGESLEY